MQRSMKYRLLTGLLTTVVCLSPVSSAGESVVADSHLDWQSRVQRAQWVGWIQVASSRSLVNAAMSKGNEQVVIDGYRYTANVMHQWKGALGDQVIFDVALSQCHRRLGLDQQLIAFGVLDYEGRHQVLSCEDLVAGEALQKVINRLGMDVKMLPKISSR
ncbi:hypothetical protein NBRC116495_00220 [Aurantivibrio plasticivorans]